MAAAADKKTGDKKPAARTTAAASSSTPSKTNRRMVLGSVVLTRTEGTGDNKRSVRVVPELNKPFDFTADELKSIMEVNPSAVRELVNEDPQEPAPDPATEDLGAELDDAARAEAQRQLDAVSDEHGASGKDGNQTLADDKDSADDDEL